MTSFAIASGGNTPNVSSPSKTSSMPPNSTVDNNAEETKSEQGHMPVASFSSMDNPSRTCTLQLFNPIADTKEIAYDSSKAREGHNEQDSSAPETATCIGGSVTSSFAGRDTNVTPSDKSTSDDGKRANVSLLFLTLCAFGGCLLRPRRHGDKSVKAVAPPRKGLRLLPMRRGIRGRIQLFKSRSSSSDGSDPTTTTTLINGEQNRLLSDTSGDSAEGFRTLPATHTDELLEASVSDVCDVSLYDNEDDKTLDDVSYAFSQSAGISEEEPRGDDDIGFGSIWDEIGTDSEGRVVSQADTDADTDGTDGGDTIISLIFDDEDETEQKGVNEDGENKSKDDNEKYRYDDDDDDKLKRGLSEVSTMFRNSIPPDELEYIQPMFTHKSLRQASEKQTSYDFIIDENEEDDELCADGKHM